MYVYIFRDYQPTLISDIQLANAWFPLQYVLCLLKKTHFALPSCKAVGPPPLHPQLPLRGHGILEPKDLLWFLTHLF